MNQNTFNIISPVDGRLVETLNYASDVQINFAISKAHRAKSDWRNTSLEERCKAVMAFLHTFAKDRDELSQLMTLQMGRPIADADEAGFLVESAEAYCALAKEKLVQTRVDSEDMVDCWMEPYPLGVHLAICAWNYPVAMIAGIVVPALLSGNVVIFKHAPQTALFSDRLNSAAVASGLPGGVFQALHMTHPDTEQLIGSGKINSMHFIGSVRGGKAVNRAIGSAFVHRALELGGKDATYVRDDADITFTARSLVEGAFGNSGQSCCSVERVYVHKSVRDELLDAISEVATAWTVGNPLDENTSMGPVVTTTGAKHINSHVADALQKGAKRLITPQDISDLPDTGTYVAPEVLYGTHHDMPLMTEETFGPTLPVMTVSDDAEAIACMNDSSYGLTGSIFSRDHEAATYLGRQLEVGLFLTNRCDYADPEVPWGGMHLSGLGRTEGPTAFEGVTQVRSFHIRKN